jgi:hypothetical protein
MEMQFYPPGNPPFIDSAECTAGFASCNNDCEEPLNFAFIQRNGVPTGPPSPQDATVNTFVNNNQTLLMNPGDKVTFRMSDARVPGGDEAFTVAMDDLTTHQACPPGSG